MPKFSRIGLRFEQRLSAALARDVGDALSTAQRLQERVLPVALEAGQPDELPGAEGQPGDLEHDLARRAVRPVGGLRGEVLGAGHQPHQLRGARAVALERRHRLAAAHHSAAIADLGDLVHPVRDEHDRGAGCDPLAHEREEPVARGDIQGRGGLVENQDLRVAHQPPGQAAGLSIAQRQRPDGHVERRRGAQQRLQDLSRTLPSRDGGNACAEQPVGAHPDVVEHRPRLDDEHLLEHGCHAGGRGAPRRRDALEPLAADLDRPGVRAVDAGEDLHQRRLARSVLSDDAVHLAAAYLERAVLQRPGGPERLDQRRRAQDNCAGRCRRGRRGSGDRVWGLSLGRHGLVAPPEPRSRITSTSSNSDLVQERGARSQAASAPRRGS